MARHTLTIAVYQESTGWELSDEHVAAIRRAAESSGAEVAVTAVSTTAQLIAVLPQTTMLVGLPLTGSQFRTHGGAVRFVQLTESLGDSASALVERLDERDASGGGGGLRVCTAASIRAPFIAEHALGLTLSTLRLLAGAVRAQSEHYWSAAELAPLIRPLRGMTVGVVSMDATGDEIACRLRPFGVNVIQTLAAGQGPRETLDHEACGTFAAPGSTEYVAFEEAASILPRSNVLILAAPTIPRTVGLFSKRDLERLPDDAVIVDVTRGGVIESNVLLQALRPRHGRLGQSGAQFTAQRTDISGNMFASRAPNTFRSDRGETSAKPPRASKGVRSSRVSRASMRLLNAFRAKDAQARNPYAYRGGEDARFAALDGFETKPLPAASPFWTMPNVAVTPGVASAGRGYWEHAVTVLGENVRAYLEQHPDAPDASDAPDEGGAGDATGGGPREVAPLRDELTAEWWHGPRETTD